MSLAYCQDFPRSRFATIAGLLCQKLALVVVFALLCSLALAPQTDAEMELSLLGADEHEADSFVIADEIRRQVAGRIPGCRSSWR